MVAPELVEALEARTEDKLVAELCRTRLVATRFDSSGGGYALVWKADKRQMVRKWKGGLSG